MKSAFNSSFCFCFLMGDIQDSYLHFIVKEMMTVRLLNISFTEVSLWHWLTRHSLSSCFYRDFLLLVLISHKREEFPWQSNIPLFHFSAYTVVALICILFDKALCLFFYRKKSSSEASQRGGTGWDWAVPSAKGERV